jgi:ubiquinone/menaquinone biosynthesis C-methylase UbiE
MAPSDTKTELDRNAEPEPNSFDAKAADWDTPARVRRAKRAAETIRSAVTFPPGARAIDLGAGTGLLGLALLDRLGELVLADTSVGMLEQAARKIRERHLDNVRAIRFDLLADPPPEGAPFDAAISLVVLHHLEDTSAALAAMHRLLVPGGQLVALDLDTEDGSFHGGTGQGVHHLGFDRSALAALTRAAGFDDVGVRDGGLIGDPEHDDTVYPLFLLTARRAQEAEGR